MFTSRCQRILTGPAGLARLAWRHPNIILLVAVPVLLAIVAGSYWWWFADWWAAQRALRLDLMPEAARRIDAYLRLHPADARAHLLASRIDRLMERYDDAEKHLEQYKEIEGASAASQLEWLLLRAHQGDLYRVETGLLYTLKTHPEDEQERLILESLARCYSKELRYRAALNCLDQLLGKDPDNVRALSWRAVLMESVDAQEDAKKDYERVLQLSPEHVATRVRLAHLLLGVHNTPKAAQHVKILEESVPDDPEVIIAVAQLRLLEGRFQEARERLDRFLADHPKHLIALYLRGKAMEEPTEMEKWFRKALAVDPSFSEAQYAFYLCLAQQPGRRREAEEAKKTYETAVKNWESFKKIQEALERTPHNPAVLAKAGGLLLDRYPVAGQNFLYQALEIDREHAAAHEALARFYETHGEPDKAAQHRKSSRSANSGR